MGSQSAHQPPGSGALRLGPFLAAALLIYALHVALVLVACPPGVVLGDRPYGVSDYNTHYQQVDTVGRALSRFGKTWAYDPGLLAGVPAGLFFDVDNKGHTLWTHGLTRLGVPQPAAFNLFTPLSCLLAPLALLLAARLLRAGRGAQLWALGLGVVLWHFDSGLRHFWSGGMISFSTVAWGAVLILALFHRLVEEPRLRFSVPLALLLALLLLVHVWTFVICVVPMVGLYVVRRRDLPLAGHLQVWAVAALAVAGNAFWLVPALRHLDLLAPAAVLGQASPIYLLADFIGVARLPFRTDFIFLHTFYRFLALGGALVTLWVWRRERDRRLLPWALAMGWLWGVAYLGGWIPLLRSTEPYRFIAPAMLISGVLFGPQVSAFLARRPWRELPRAARAATLLLALLLVPRAVGDVLYFLPELSPPAYVGAGDPAEAGVADFRPAPPVVRPFRLTALGDNVYELAAYLREHCPGEGRVLVREWPVAEALHWMIDRGIMGGFGERRTIHEAANLFRRIGDPRLRGAELARYLERYAVRYVVVGGPPQAELELRSDLLRLRKVVAGFRVHEVLRPSRLVARGSGEVRADLNRIEVRDARPAAGEALVLRFHHMQGLRCAPGCRVEREPVPGDPAGFIRVVGAPRIPSRFSVELVY